MTRPNCLAFNMTRSNYLSNCSKFFSGVIAIALSFGFCHHVTTKGGRFPSVLCSRVVFRTLLCEHATQSLRVSFASLCEPTHPPVRTVAAHPPCMHPPPHHMPTGPFHGAESQGALLVGAFGLCNSILQHEMRDGAEA